MVLFGIAAVFLGVGFLQFSCDFTDPDDIFSSSQAIFSLCVRSCGCRRSLFSKHRCLLDFPLRAGLFFGLGSVTAGVYQVPRASVEAV